MAESTSDCIRYFCGCERSVPDKTVAWCAAHAGQRHSYTELLRDKRRIKEVISLGTEARHVAYLKRQLTLQRKAKRAFWAALDECPQREERALAPQDNVE